MPKRSITQIVFVLFVLTVSLLLVGCGEDGDAPAATTDATTDTTATTDSTDIQSEAGGVPSAAMWTVGVTKASLPVAAVVGEEHSFDIYFKDRLSVFSGMSDDAVVHIRSEDGNGNIEQFPIENGKATITLRVHDGTIYDHPGSEAAAWETDLQNTLNSTTYDWYYGAPNGTPSNYWKSVLWWTEGQEQFDEVEGQYYNQRYDKDQDTFLAEWDTHPEPYLDVNENGLHDEHEWFKDVDGDGNFAPKNGEWDEDILISGNTTFNFTSDEVLVGWKKTGVDVPDEGSEYFTVIVCDSNMNHLPAGATITFAVDNGEIRGPSSFTIENNRAERGNSELSQLGNISYEVKIFDSATVRTDVVVTVTVAGEGVNGVTAKIYDIVELL